MSPNPHEQPAPRSDGPISVELAPSVVLFDLDGTLVDSLPIVVRTFQAVVATAGIRTPDSEIVEAALAVGGPATILDHLLGRPSAPEELASYELQLARSLDEVPTFPGIAETVDGLVAKKISLGVVTGATARTAHAVLSATGLADAFDAVVGSDEVTRTKPHPDSLLLACDRLDAAPDRAWYVGDKCYDIDAARRGGLRPHLAGWNPRHDEGCDEAVLLSKPTDLLRLL